MTESKICFIVYNCAEQTCETMRAHSSAGRAPALQAGGHRFEPYCAHHTSRVDEEYAGIAQLVEQLICNQQVGGSSPSASSMNNGGVPEWLKGADCKSVGSAYIGSNPISSTKNMRKWLRGRASPCQGEGREFESRLPLQKKMGAAWSHPHYADVV